MSLYIKIIFKSDGSFFTFRLISATKPLAPNVSNDVLHFLNNLAGKKKYYPRSKEQMEAAFEQHVVNNYFELFNKFGQTGAPTSIRVKISTAAIEIDTYTVDDSGKSTLFDSFKAVK